MTDLHSSRINVASLVAKIVFSCSALVCAAPLSAFAQEVPSQPTRAFLPNQAVVVANLPLLKAPSAERPAVVATALETMLRDKEVCCGKNSALENAVLSAGSLKELSANLQGRHVLGDGRPVMVRTEYFPQSSTSARLIVKTLMDQQPMLLEWKSRVYVLYGANFDEIRQYNPDDWLFTIHKLLLLDVRFSDQQREIEFNNPSDDWKIIQGLMTLSVVRP
jgi:hypothetical protein